MQTIGVTNRAGRLPRPSGAFLGALVAASLLEGKRPPSSSGRVLNRLCFGDSFTGVYLHSYQARV